MNNMHVSGDEPIRWGNFIEVPVGSAVLYDFSDARTQLTTPPLDSTHTLAFGYQAEEGLFHGVMTHQQEIENIVPSVFSLFDLNNSHFDPKMITRAKVLTPINLNAKISHNSKHLPQALKEILGPHTPEDSRKYITYGGDTRPILRFKSPVEPHRFKVIL